MRVVSSSLPSGMQWNEMVAMWLSCSDDFPNKKFYILLHT